MLIGERHGMFGATRRPGHLRLRRPASRPILLPGAAAAALRRRTSTRSPTPSARPSPAADGLGYARRRREGRRRPRRADALRAPRAPARRRARAARRPRRCASRCASASPACTTPARPGRELHAVYHLLSITHGSRRVRLEVTAPRRRPAHPVDRLGLPAQRLARARDVGHVRHRQFDGHPALTRILMPDDWPGPPAAQGLPARRHPRRVQGRAPIPPPDQRRAYS